MLYVVWSLFSVYYRCFEDTNRAAVLTSNYKCCPWHCTTHQPCHVCFHKASVSSCLEHDTLETPVYDAPTLKELCFLMQPLLDSLTWQVKKKNRVVLKIHKLHYKWHNGFFNWFNLHKKVTCLVALVTHDVNIMIHEPAYSFWTLSGIFISSRFYVIHVFLTYSLVCKPHPLSLPQPVNVPLVELSIHTKTSTDTVSKKKKNERADGLNLLNHNKSEIQPPAPG